MAQLYAPAGPRAKARVFLGYCGLVSALVATWVASGTGFGFSLAWSLLALGFVVLLSIGLGRRLPGWGFLAPPVLALGWLAVVLTTVPARPGEEAPTAQGLLLVFLVATALAAEAGVLVGAMSAVWKWTGNASR
jgi:hypothetical protein